MSAIFSAVLSALLVSGTAAVVFSGFSLNPRLRCRAAHASALTGAGVAAVYVVLRGAAEAFRFSSGSPVNLGTLEFVGASLGQLAGPVLIEYAPLALLLLISTAGFSTLVFFYLNRPLEGCRRPWEILGRGVASLAALTALCHMLTTPGLSRESGLHETADLALLASVAGRVEEREEMKKNAERLGVVVPAGPRLSAGSLWEKAASHLEGARPNVVLVMMESVGVSHLGFHGYERPTTPELDAIAAQSLRFQRARSTASHSNYAQMGILSSLFPRRFSGLDTYERLDYPRFLWHDMLDSLGYQTATHSSQDETWQGMLRFQTTDTHTEFHHARTYEGRRIKMGSEKIVPDEVTVTRAIHWMDQQEGPFGLYVNLQATHFPYRVPEGAPEPYQPTRPTRGKYHYLSYPKSDVPTVINRYDNALAYIDRQIGRIYSYLERSGKLDETIVVITSDHGESFGQNGLVTHGRSVFEEEVRVPLLVHYPDAIAPGDDYRAVSTLDILPTIAQLLEVPPHPAFQGQSLVADVPDPHRPVFINIQGMKSADAVVCESYKFVLNRSEGKKALYDLDSDPLEEKNILASAPHLGEQLETLLRAQMRMQMRYHSPKNASLRKTRFAPRFASCPHFGTEPPEQELPDVHASVAN